MPLRQSIIDISVRFIVHLCLMGFNQLELCASAYALQLINLNLIVAHQVASYQLFLV